MEQKHCRCQNKILYWCFKRVRSDSNYQWGNQKPQIEGVQTPQWPQEKGQMDKQRSTKHYTPLKTACELRCSRMVSNSCSTSDTHRATFVTIISRRRVPQVEQKLNTLPNTWVHFRFVHNVSWWGSWGSCWESTQLRDIFFICRCLWNVATYKWKVHNGKF
jgi:hypothetical protein